MKDMKERKQWKEELRNPDIPWKSGMINWQKPVQSKKKIRIKANSAAVNTTLSLRVSDQEREQEEKTSDCPLVWKPASSIAKLLLFLQFIF